MHLGMNEDHLSMNNYMQVPQITPKPPVSILKSNHLMQLTWSATLLVMEWSA